MPDSRDLSGLDASAIAQTYLVSERGAERVRERMRGVRVEYTHTIKRRIDGMSSEEDERVITRAEYDRLLSERETEGSVVEKTRVLLPYGGHTFEIDIYPFWKRVAVMEVEVEDEDEKIELPPQIKVIKEVTGDGRFSNHSLSRRIPDEESLIDPAEDVDMERIDGDGGRDRGCDPEDGAQQHD